MYEVEFWVPSGGFELIGVDWFCGDMDREETQPVDLDLVVFRARSGFVVQFWRGPVDFLFFYLSKNESR